MLPAGKSGSTLDKFMQNPTLANYRRLRLELAASGLTVEQALPDLARFLAWKGKGFLLEPIRKMERK